MTTSPPEPSALSSLIASSGAKSASDSLSIEILHNLQYQHNWTDLKRHLICLNTLPNYGLLDLNGLGLQQHPRSHPPSSSGTSTPTAGETIALISGLPTRHAYIHPDFQNYLVRHSIEETSIPIQREYVLPLSLSESWTLGRFCAVFDQLPERHPLIVEQAPGGQRQYPGGNQDDIVNGNANITPARYEHHDQKRVLLGLKAKEGGGGDGTIVYYIMQEGEVKPRQNG
ncbi:hypothetical protein LTR10_011697 [Elasticomyces elasticus]|uniref:tRNA-splicing endonuclease subunit Sen15 domain-containing protein n=1 Tax=Exophiala sideris TaxID=1016849 RepID=A0ABR0JEW3_9EURO|nr:hypothetical protein LTR10_011697 [Elasticomyces elasticus]KAK5031843.1 hypothetical protein LTS07_004464 [Exophiala sideris]KAK5040772.1 hypothetical protein LTR13_003073 [Exophiala sideris]KAK5061892.1 hypothetical protein LTR69_005076 [Exophiala sideris]KAK5184592.1 hypothetical protein LTR44_003267 [Eurotiomycetes sp. CCFEE 6388]